MDILILNWKDIKNPEVGGAEVIAFEFARRLVRDGHNVTFFSRSFHTAKPTETIDGVNIVRKGNKLTVYLQAFLYYRRLQKKPDRVVDMINTLCWQTPLYVPSSQRIAYINQLAKDVLFYELPWPVSWVGYFLERFEYIPYKRTKFICYSESTRSDLAQFGIRKNNIQLFPLGLDHTRYKPRSEKTTYPLFIFVARLVRMKRADLCIKAMQLVIQKYPNAVLAIIGNGPEERNLEAMVVKNKMQENIRFVNKENFFIDKNKRDTKVSYMQQAWGLLLPSVKEGWGMVVTEAAACGTPAIVSNVTGLRDSVRNGKTGIILSVNPSVKELASAMIALIEKTDTRKEMSKNALSWSQNFSWEKSYQIFKSFITKPYEKN